MNNVLDYLSGKVGLIVGATVVVITMIVGFSLFGAYNSARNGMIERETALSAQYLDNQNQLSAYVQSVKEAMGVANTAAESIDIIISDAIKGRYDNESGNVDANMMINVVAEAYPDLSATAINYQVVQDVVISGRTAYKNQQSRLLDMLREYDSWRNSGVIHSRMVAWAGAPSEHLVARVGSNKWSGKDALDKMYEIILTKEALTAYETGEDVTLDTSSMRPEFGNEKDANNR